MAWAQVGNIKGIPGTTGATGAPGTPGAPGIGFTWRGTWSGSTAYAINDCVISNNQTYVCIVAGTGFDPSTDVTHWNLMVGTPVADWNTMVNKPSTFPPAPHAASHLPGTGGFTSGGETSSIPTGTVLDFAGPIVPSGFLLCDGSAIDRQTYATLFGVIGTIYGQGDGVSTFTLPAPVDAMFNKIIKT